MGFQYTVHKQMLQLHTPQHTHHIRLKPQQRRSVRLHTNREYQLEMLIPKSRHFSLSHFIHNQHTWLEQQLAAHLQQLNDKLHWYDFNGKRKTIVRRDISHIQEHSDSLHLPSTWHTKQALLQLTGYQRKQAYQLGSVRLEHWWQRFDYPQSVPVLRIKQMRTRWGSMSSKHNLNLSLALFAYPLAQIDLVLVHELCHIQHMNHSPAFYALLQQHLPDWRVREAVLRRQ